MGIYKLVNGTLTIEGGNLGVNNTNPISELDVTGKIAITQEQGSTPSAPADGQGYLYTKNDGKLYWRSYDVSETDLTAGGGASKLSAMVNGYMPLSTASPDRVVNFVDLTVHSANGTGGSSLRTRLIAPFNGIIKTIIVTMKHNATPDASNTGSQTIKIYKNQGGISLFASPSYSSTYSHSDYSSAVATNIDGAGSNLYNKVLSPALAITQGDHIHVAGVKTAGGAHDGHITIVMEET